MCHSASLRAVAEQAHRYRPAHHFSQIDAPSSPPPDRGVPRRAEAERGTPATLRTLPRLLQALLAAGDLVAEPDQRVVLAVGDALLHRDQRVVRDLDVLGADLGAALGDVAEAQAVLLLRLLAPLTRVERVHVELGDAHQVARTGERLLVLLVIAHHVAGVLAQVALDALAELLRALDVHLGHPVLARLEVLRRLEGRDLPGLLVVE